MNTESIVKSLESLVKSKSDKRKIIRFDSGTVQELVKKYCKELAPYSKVACFFDSESFDSLGRETDEAVKSEGGKVVNSVSDSDNFSVEDAGDMMSLLEDARLIMCFSNKEIGFCSYLSMIKNIPLCVIVTKWGIEEIIPSRIEIINGKRVDYVKLNAKTYILIEDSDFSEADLPQIYLSIEKNIVSLIDYKIGCEINEYSYDNEIFNETVSAIKSAYEIYKESFIDMPSVLVKNKLTVELCNYLTDGNLVDYSGIRSAERILGRLSDEKTVKSPKLFMKMIGLYKIYLSKDFDDILEIANSNQRADKMAELFNTTATEYLNNFLSQSEMIKKRKKQIEKVCENLYSIVQVINEKKRNFDETFISLGGESYLSKENSDIAIKHAGDIAKEVNTVSLIRESGILELI